MNAAAIEAVAGPLKGTIFQLSDDDSSIGRDPSNAISIRDGSASRHHCVIRKRDGRFIIEDLESRNRTLVNGSAVTEHTLEPGDEIKVGSSVFRFIAGEESDSTSEELEIGEVPTSTIVLRKEDAVYL